MRFSRVICAFLLTIPIMVSSQKPKKYTTSEIHHEIQKLNFLGTALFVAAHPDDENTRLIAYLSNKVKARTAYLSLTRGDGGQNLIGPELRELLGVLRTQELLAARRVDGGEQFFSRANDFGYSKHPDETLTIWDKEMVLGDVVWAIRKFRPDIIVNRFDHRSPGTTHGHHTTSAMLSFEAFDLVNDPRAYPEQLSKTQVWEPKRLFFNTSWWFYGSREKFAQADKSNLTQVDVGVFYPNLGLSNNEIASSASSQHLCQGFGRLAVRGAQPDYLEFLKGDPLNGSTDIFEGINTTWSRVKGGEAVGAILNAIEAKFNFSDPTEHLPDLIKAYKLLQEVEDEHWKQLKSEHLKDIILACGGIYLEAGANSASAIPGEKVNVTIEALNRSNTSLTLQSIKIEGTDVGTTPNISLSPNTKENLEISFSVPEDTPYTTPYWLQQKGTLGMYHVDDKSLIGQPETPVAYTVDFGLTIDGVPITFTKPLIRRYSKPDVGEIYEPFVVLPKVSASFTEDVYLFNTPEPVNVNLAIRAGTNNVSGVAKLKLPQGWSSHPSVINFNIAQKNAVQNVAFEVIPPTGENVGTVSPILIVDGEEFQKKLVEITYDHVPKQSILLPSEARVVRMDIKKEGERIGYIVGAGDKVPESLSQIGYQVETLDVSELEIGSLAQYDGVVLGIRAYNVLEELKFKQPILLDYVKNGGNMIVQYNTAGRWRAQFENIAPYPITISRDRVTDENAQVTILAKEHAIMNYPNKIEARDFNGWVQERGLYFPNEWSKEFIPILAMADKGENSKEGSLLVASYGKGNYIYTGLSFFRELPAGVPGAYKLFANMLSLKKQNTQDEGEIKG
ncbi:PIG-L family deacetylase [Flavobacteriaceae bacterium GF1]